MLRPETSLSLQQFMLLYKPLPTYTHQYLVHQRENMLNGWKGLFDISNGSSTEFNFIIYIRSYEWICNKTSIAPKIMILGIFEILLNPIVIMVMG